MKAQQRIHRVLVVDDHPVVTAGIRETLAGEDDLEVVGSAATLSEATAAIERERPDVALVDLTLEKNSGLNVIKTIAGMRPEVRVLVFTMHDEALYAERTLRAGAHGFVHKGVSSDELIAAIRKTLEGRLVISDQMNARLVQKALSGQRKAEGVSSLSDRELEVFQLIGQGAGIRKIAEALGISVKTVETHRENIKKKLDVGSASQLTRFAVAWVENPA